MHRSKIFSLVLLFLLVTTLNINHIKCKEIRAADEHDDDEQKPSNQAYTNDIDEGSCICGLNKEILSKIEAIVTQASKQQSCSIHAGQDDPSKHEITGHTQISGQEEETPANGENQSPDIVTNSTSTDSQQQNHDDQKNTDSADNNSTDTGSQSGTSESLIAKLTEEIHLLQAQLTASLKPQDSAQSQQNPGPSLTSVFSSMWRPQQQIQPEVPSSTLTSSWQLLPPTSAPIQTTTMPSTDNDNNGQQEMPVQPSSKPELTSEHAGPESSSASNSFLQGLPASSSTSTPLSQHSNGFNQTGQGGQTSIQAVQDALESTVPNVVSNIFANIQDLAIQTEHNSSAGASGPTEHSNFLTSIDGSSVHLNKNETADEITAQGEQLFLQWIDHQLQALHMTASMASYIRKSALSLFRRIVRQYVERVGRLGGRVEDNVRKATQVALNNTQTLTSFILRNYLNFAGGLMQIIGEQVSRVGKQIDSTGETIAHINLNPFDIVSNVVASLPNPSHYSEYFRAFGKYLMGETQQDGYNTNQQQQQHHQQQQQQQEEQEGDRRRGLLSKTIGALGKTLGSWLG